MYALFQVFCNHRYLNLINLYEMYTESQTIAVAIFIFQKKGWQIITNVYETL